MSMSKQPLLSVVVPCFNRADYLVPTIDSILTQDYPNIECVVMDGGSQDGTIEILEGYGDKVRWISQPDKGPQDAINRGWAMCEGEILAWLNADDLWAPGAVSQVVTYFREHPETDVVYGDCGIINQEGRHIDTALIPEWNLRYAIERCDNIIYQPAAFMRRTILEHVGWLYPKLLHDHELWLRISLAGGRLAHFPSVLAYIRDHVDNLGHRPDLVIPLKLGITKQVFDYSNLPPEIRHLKNRAISNTYLRGIDFVLLGRFRWGRDWLKCIGLFWKAVRADWSNFPRAILIFLAIPPTIIYISLRGYLPDRLKQELRKARIRAR